MVLDHSAEHMSTEYIIWILFKSLCCLSFCCDKLFLSWSKGGYRTVLSLFSSNQRKSEHWRIEWFPAENPYPLLLLKLCLPTGSLSPPKGVGRRHWHQLPLPKTHVMIFVWILSLIGSCEYCIRYLNTFWGKIPEPSSFTVLQQCRFFSS